MQLTAEGFSPSVDWLNMCCFAGDQDQMVVAASKDHSLRIWSVPKGEGNATTIDQSIVTLRGHQNTIRSVRYSKATSTLASGGHEGVIKLWT